MNRETRKKTWLYGPIAAAAVVPLILGGVSTVAWANDAAPVDEALVDVAAAAEAQPEVQPTIEAAATAEAGTPAEDAPTSAEGAAPVEVEPVAPPPAPLLPEPAPTSTHDPQDPGPTVTITLPASDWTWYSGPVQAVIRASSRLGDIQTLTWSTSGAQPGGETVNGPVATITIDQPGSTTIEAWASDGEYGSAPVSKTVKIDVTPPVNSVASPAPGVYVVGQDFTPHADCEDPESGIYTQNQLVPCGAYIHRSGQTFGWQNETNQTWGTEHLGVWELGGESMNRAGQRGQTVVGTIRVVEDEHVPPTSTHSAPAVPASGWYSAPFAVTITGADAGSGVRQIDYRLPDPEEEWGPWITVSGETAQVPVATDGTTRVQYRAVDYLYNYGAIHEASFPLDATAPLIGISGPAEGTHVAVGDDLRLTYTCSDALSGIASCGGTAESGGKLDTTEPGTFEAVVIATDTAGNRTEVRRSYIVDAPDTEGPVVTFTREPVPASGWYTVQAVPFSIDATDPSGVATVHWEVTSPDGSVGAGGTTGGSASGMQITREGTTVVRVWAVDTLGNESERQSFTFALDRTAPHVWVDSPEAEYGLVTATREFELGEQVDLEFDCADAEPGSGVASCESSVGDTLPTDELGTFEVTLTATDGAGLTGVETLRYTVVEATEEPTEEPQRPDDEPAAAPGLARTGSEPATALAFGGALLVGGILALLVGVTRRRA